MALKLTVDTLDGVDEPLRALYEPDGDKFKLKVDGLEDTSGLKTALQSERQARATYERQAKQWGALGKTPEEINELLVAQAKAEEDKLNKAGEWDKLRAQMNDKHAAELQAERDRNAAKDKALARFMIDGEAAKAIAAAKGVPELLLPHVQRFARMVESDGDYSVQIVDAKGDPRVNAKGEPLTISDLIAEMRASDVFGRAFDGTDKSGSGKPPGVHGGGGTSRTYTLTAFNALSAAERAAAMKAGATITET